MPLDFRLRCLAADLADEVSKLLPGNPPEAGALADDIPLQVRQAEAVPACLLISHGLPDRMSSFLCPRCRLVQKSLRCSQNSSKSVVPRAAVTRIADCAAAWIRSAQASGFI